MEEGGRCRGKRGTSLNTAVLVSDPAGLSCFFGLGLYAMSCGTDAARAVPSFPPEALEPTLGRELHPGGTGESKNSTRSAVLTL